MNQLVQALADGVTQGAVYAIIALGFVIVYKSTGVLNFAHGGLLMLGAYLTLTFIEHSLDFYLAVLLAMLLTGGIGWLLQAGLLRKLVEEDVFSVVLVTLGLSLVIRAVVGVIYGPTERPLDAPFDGPEIHLFADVYVSRSGLAAVAVSAAVFLGAWLFFARSRQGLAMRAIAEDQAVARLMGISASRVFVLAWVIAGGLAALAGTLAAEESYVSNNLGAIGLLALPAAVIGGLDSVAGALLGGLLVGIVEQAAGTYLGGQTATLASFVLLVLVLAVKPEGLLGQREIVRV